MFNFRIITIADGSQIIDRSIKTPDDALTPIELIEYIEVNNAMDSMDRMERKARKRAEHIQKLARNPLYRMASMIGLI